MLKVIVFCYMLIVSSLAFSQRYDSGDEKEMGIYIEKLGKGGLLPSVIEKESNELEQIEKK
jgi:hypothetical protein